MTPEAKKALEDAVEPAEEEGRPWNTYEYIFRAALAYAYEDAARVCGQGLSDGEDAWARGYNVAKQDAADWIRLRAKEQSK